jgi:predicted transcriptional regulator
MPAVNDKWIPQKAITFLKACPEASARRMAKALGISEGTARHYRRLAVIRGDIPPRHKGAS